MEKFNTTQKLFLICQFKDFYMKNFIFNTKIMINILVISSSNVFLF